MVLLFLIFEYAEGIIYMKDLCWAGAEDRAELFLKEKKGRLLK